MSQAPINDGTKTAQGAWTSWLAIAVVAIVMGFLLPQLMPSEGVPERPAAKAETKDAGKLEYTAPTLPAPPSMQGMFVRLGAGTAVVLGLCVATLWGVRRWMYPVAANGTLPRDLRLMETLHLGNRCSVHLVHLNKQAILIGVDGSGIKTVVPLPAAFEEVLIDADAADDQEEPVSKPRLAA